jgi:polysaccharide deacetylase family protein (PEP-CTERM system associated)
MSILNALTIDVEDYFHSDAVSHAVPREFWEQMPSRLEPNVERILDLLARNDIRATFFFVGWIAERHPNLVALVHQLGHEVGCHSYWHRPVYWLSPDQFREDTHRARSVIEDSTGAPVYGYRAPMNSISPEVDWAFEVLAEMGFTYDASVNPCERRLYPTADAWRFPYTVASDALLELPNTTLRWATTVVPVSSGACLRRMPYAYVAHSIRQLNKLKHPAIVQLEPCDLDPDQPRLPVPFFTALKQYSGLRRTEARLERLLKEFKLGPMSQAFDTHFASLEALAC